MLLASDFFSMYRFMHGMKVVIAVPILGGILAALIACILLRRRLITDLLTRREAIVWSLIAAGMFFMLFSVSAPVWSLLNTLFGIAAAPWRVQSILLFASIYLFSVYSQWLVKPEKWKVWFHDCVLIWFLLLVMAVFMDASRPSEDDALVQNLRQAYIMGMARSNQTRWTTPEYSDEEALLAETCPPGPNVEVAEGSGHAVVTQWDDNGIRIEADVPQKSVLVIRQYYFPLWHARIDETESTLMPQKDTGRMLLSVPAGHHQVRLYTSIHETAPGLYRLAQAMSLFAALIFVVGYGRRYLRYRSELR